MDSTVVATMDKVCDSLDSELLSAGAAIATTWFGSEEQKLAAITAIKQATNMVAAVEGPKYDEVITGARTFQSWAYQAQVAHEQIANAIGSTKEWTMTQVIAATLGQTVEDVKQGAKDLESGAFPWAVVIVLGLIALVFLRLVG